MRSDEYLRDIRWWRLVESVTDRVDLRQGNVKLVQLKPGAATYYDDQRFIMQEADRRFDGKWAWR